MLLFMSYFRVQFQKKTMMERIYHHHHHHHHHHPHRGYKSDTITDVSGGAPPLQSQTNRIQFKFSVKLTEKTQMDQISDTDKGLCVLVYMLVCVL